MGEAIFSEVIETTITDGNATKETIIGALENIQSQSRPEDIFIFFYAGHGVMNDGKKGQNEFYIVATDITQLYGNDILLSEKGISASEIQSYSQNINAQKQLFILDACQIGGATEMLVLCAATEERAIAQLARSTGLFG